MLPIKNALKAVVAKWFHLMLLFFFPFFSVVVLFFIQLSQNCGKLNLDNRLKEQCQGQVVWVLATSKSFFPEIRLEKVPRF